ncbi:hypothetical protein H6F89_30335 [Cyanobacteria bacterium FACHB-63]|nr:hypothetical protein [Cyanobacteria bacterium FACHB-63]
MSRRKVDEIAVVRELLAGKSPATIADENSVTPTRIRQIRKKRIGHLSEPALKAAALLLGVAFKKPDTIPGGHRKPKMTKTTVKKTYLRIRRSIEA